MSNQKLEVKKEGREGVYLVEKETLKKWILAKKFKQIHNFISSGGMVLGADHDVKSVLKDIDNAERLGILDEERAGQNMGHSLSIIKNEKLECYDIGKITSEDLIIFK
jgi:hypothetical protein